MASSSTTISEEGEEIDLELGDLSLGDAANEGLSNIEDDIQDRYSLSNYDEEDDDEDAPSLHDNRRLTDKELKKLMKSRYITRDYLEEDNKLSAHVPSCCRGVRPRHVKIGGFILLFLAFIGLFIWVFTELELHKPSKS